MEVNIAFRDAGKEGTYPDTWSCKICVRITCFLLFLASLTGCARCAPAVHKRYLSGVSELSLVSLMAVVFFFCIACACRAAYYFHVCPTWEGLTVPLFWVAISCAAAFGILVSHENAIWVEIAQDIRNIRGFAVFWPGTVQEVPRNTGDAQTQG